MQEDDTEEEVDGVTEGEESSSPERIIRRYPFVEGTPDQEFHDAGLDTGPGDTVAAEAMQARYSAAEKFT